MDISKLETRWEYISGGFSYIDQTHAGHGANTLQLAAGELKAYLDSISVGPKERQDQIISALHLTVKPISFAVLPESFEIMLETDMAYLKTAPETPLNEEFGSVAMVLLYREIAETISADSPIPDAMERRIIAASGKMPDLGNK